MVKKVILSEDAKNDLENLFQYFLEFSESYADFFANEFFEYLDLLETNPKLGKKVPEIDIENFRQILIGKFRVLYKITENVEILAIKPNN